MTQAQRPRNTRLQGIQDAIPVLLQISGYVGFVAAQILWLGFSRPEPEFMAIMIGVTGAGYVSKGLAALKQSLPDPPSDPGEGE